MKWLLGLDLALSALAGLMLVTPAQRAAGEDNPAVTLFNGKDLTGFYTFLGTTAKGAKPYGKNNDPEKVFTVLNGVLRV